VVGGIVAATHHYWSNLHNLKQIASALLPPGRLRR